MQVDDEFSVYTNESLKYPLNNNEYDKIGVVWSFLNRFMSAIISVSEYRKKLISSIREECNEDDFFKMEIICEKLLWNLIDKVKYLYKDNDFCIDCITDLNENGIDEILDKFYEDNSYRSFINKLILIDDTKGKIYHRPMEGSASLFKNNEMNSKVLKILAHRKLYEQIMKNPKKIQLVETPKYYICGDYGFPNLNLGKPFIQSDNFRRKRIKNMYYNETYAKNEKLRTSENYWYKLMLPN